jgi:hypothetical protein
MTATVPAQLAPTAPAVAFAEIYVEQTVPCGASNMHFGCVAGYEEWALSHEIDEVEAIHAAFQAGGVPYVVTTYGHATCELFPGESCNFCQRCNDD